MWLPTALEGRNFLHMQVLRCLPDRTASPVNDPSSPSMALARIHLYLFTPYSTYFFYFFFLYIYNLVRTPSSQAKFMIYDGSQPCSGGRPWCLSPTRVDGPGSV